MRCPYCKADDSRVIDSRPTSDGSKIRRRRECIACLARFNTYEVVETLPIIIVKKDKSRETFNKEKLINGILKACEKRPIPLEKVERAVDSIEDELRSMTDREINSGVVGEYVMHFLKSIDKVAYVRFASVYRDFSDIDSFMDELKGLLKDKSKS